MEKGTFSGVGGDWDSSRRHNADKCKMRNVNYGFFFHGIGRQFTGELKVGEGLVKDMIWETRLDMNAAIHRNDKCIHTIQSESPSYCSICRTNDTDEG